MPVKVDLALAFKMEPREAVKYFKEKDYLISDNWADVWQKQHARAFTVAKAAKLSVLREIRLGLDKALAAGATEREFIKTLKPALAKMGWWGKDKFGRQLGSTRRLKTIFRTNMASSYNAGRYREQKRRAESRPYWQYVAVLDQRTRDQHRDLNGKVFRHDDPFWDYFYPPNGSNCRCRVRALSERKLKREGLKVEATKGDLPKVEKRIKRIDYRTGEVQYRNVDVHLYRGRNAAGRRFAVTPHPGFDYNPGKRWPKWDPLGNNPMEIPGKWTPNPKFKQRNWKDRRLKPAAEEKWASPKLPEILDEASDQDAATEVLVKSALGDREIRVVMTPEGSVVITRGGLKHIASDRRGRRERYANFILPTLQDPDEIWLAFYDKEREYRKRYIKIFERDDYRFLSIVRENADGNLLITFFKSRDWDYIDRQREGALLYKRMGE